MNAVPSGLSSPISLACFAPSAPGAAIPKTLDIGSLGGSLPVAEGHHDAIVRAWAAFGKIGWKRHTALCCRRGASRSGAEREGWGVLAGAQNHRDGPGATAQCRLAGSTTRPAGLGKRPITEVREARLRLSFSSRPSRSLDHFVSNEQHRLRDRQAKRSGCLETDHKAEARGLLDRKVTGLRAPQNPVDVFGCDSRNL